MCMKMISVIQCQNPTGSIALRLSANALIYSIWYASDKLRWKRQVHHSKLLVSFFFFNFTFLLKIKCVYFFLFKNIFKDSQKEKNHFKKITISRQLSIREIGNFGMDQLRYMGRIQWWVSCLLTVGVQANFACWHCSPASTLPCPYYLV